MNGGRTCHMPGRAAARKHQGDGDAVARVAFSLSRTPDFIPETNAASWPQTTSPVCPPMSKTFSNQGAWNDANDALTDDAPVERITYRL